MIKKSIKEIRKTIKELERAKQQAKLDLFTLQLDCGEHTWTEPKYEPELAGLIGERPRWTRECTTCGSKNSTLIYKEYVAPGPWLTPLWSPLPSKVKKGKNNDKERS